MIDQAREQAINQINKPKQSSQVMYQSNVPKQSNKAIKPNHEASNQMTQ